MSSDYQKFEKKKTLTEKEVNDYIEKKLGEVTQSSSRKQFNYLWTSEDVFSPIGLPEFSDKIPIQSPFGKDGYSKGNKHVGFDSGDDPTPQRIPPNTKIASAIEGEVIRIASNGSDNIYVTETGVITNYIDSTTITPPISYENFEKTLDTSKAKGYVKSKNKIIPYSEMTESEQKDYKLKEYALKLEPYYPGLGNNVVVKSNIDGIDYEITYAHMSQAPKVKNGGMS